MPIKEKIIGVLLVTAFTAIYVLSTQGISLRESHLNASPLSPEAGAVTAAEAAWYCPMHPEISQRGPGACPICGMKLVATAAGAHSHEHGVEVDAATQHNLGVRLATVKVLVIGQTLRTFGNVIVDENRVFSVRPRYEGWVRKLHVHSVGEKVRQGEVLYEIYSPDLIGRQRAYLNALERKKQILQTLSVPAFEENKFLMDLFQQLAKDRAALVQQEGLSVESLQQMEDTKQIVEVVQIVAHRSGIVTQINVQEGGYVTPASALMSLADLSRAWVDVSLYPEAGTRVRLGDAVSIMDAGGTVIASRLSFVSPFAENNKVHARAEVDLTHAALKPGIYVDVSILTQPHQSLVLPRSAIIYSAQGNRVMLAREGGHFLPVSVQTGVEDGDWVEILDGLQKGAEVAVNGQFLLDAAASMGATAERFQSMQP